MRPDWEARPAWNGLHMVPNTRLSLRPGVPRDAQCIHGLVLAHTNEPRARSSRSEVPQSRGGVPACHVMVQAGACTHGASGLQADEVGGEEFVAGLLLHSERASRAGGTVGACASLDHYMAGWHATSTLGHLASAAACSRLLGLSEKQTVYALGIGGTQASGLKRVFGTMCKPFHAGRASQSGLIGPSGRAGVYEPRTSWKAPKVSSRP